jgi:hypothetical protein
MSAPAERTVVVVLNIRKQTIPHDNRVYVVPDDE